MGLALAAAVLLLVIVVLLGFFVLDWPSVEQKEQLTTRDLFDLLKLAFAVAAGIGAVVALVMGYRRQWVAESTDRRGHASHILEQEIAGYSQHDLIQRRITDLYSAAMDQIGNDKPQVRIGGLYALERLGQENSRHRQAVVDILCGYLRLPFAFPEELAGEFESRNTRYTNVEGTTEQRAAATSPAIEALYESASELQVRLTAQRILSTHLAADSTQSDDINGEKSFWNNIDLDLTGAALIAFNLRIRARNARFTRAVFRGESSFRDARFSGRAWFDNAHFLGDSTFFQAEFENDVRFDSVIFQGAAYFNEAKFRRRCWFTRAQFHSDTWFSKAEFCGPAFFDTATFHQPAQFNAVRFAGAARFNRCSFAGRVIFAGISAAEGVRLDDSEIEVKSGYLPSSLPAGWDIRHSGRGDFYEFFELAPAS